MNVFNVDRLLCHLQNRDGIAQQLLDGIIPILLVAAAGIALVLAHIDDFQIEIDEVFNLSAAASGTFRLTVEIVEGLLVRFGLRGSSSRWAFAAYFFQVSASSGLAQNTTPP